jgi:hypothetical protein
VTGPTGGDESRRIGRESVGTNCHDQTIRLFTPCSSEILRSIWPEPVASWVFVTPHPDAPWRTRLDATIATQHARARALARLGGTSSQSTRVIPAHAVILEGALIRSRRRRQSAVKEARHRQPGYQLQSPRPLPLVQDPPIPRYAGAQQERQHSAAAGGTRDRLPPARGSIAASRRVGINFAFVISSQWCACRCTACAHSLSEFF